MAKGKTSTVFNIIGNGTRLYLQNLLLLSTPVIAPVLGLILSVVLFVIPVWLLPQYYPGWAEQFPIFKEVWFSIIIIILTILPGLVVLKLSFWNYMLKLVSLNVMVSDIIKKKVIKHHTQYTKIIELRTKDYLLMLGIWCLIILMGLFLPVSLFLFNIDAAILGYLLIGFEFVAVFLLSILSIYLSLSFQVFAFETSFGPMQTLEESFNLVLNNFWRIVVVMIVLALVTSLIVPQVFVFVADALMLKNTIAIPFQHLLENILKNNQYAVDMLQSFSYFGYESEAKFILEKSKDVSELLIAMIISLLMLPLGSCYYTLFYFDAKKRHTPVAEKPADDKVSEKKSKKGSKKKKNV